MEEYGLIGYPLGHSFSKNFFNEKFESENLDATYKNFEIPGIEELPEVLLRHKHLHGLNVTIPYKQKVISFLDEIDESARSIGAVNVIKVSRKSGGKIFMKGYNSDFEGFLQSIKPLLQPHHKKALILGTGGASKAVNYALHDKLGLETIFVSRFHRPGMVTYDAITPEAVHEYEVIVNCTPCGMFPHVNDSPSLPYYAMTSNNLLYDLIYNPDETMFMRQGAMNGAVVKNGLEMLLLQAQISWDIWQDTTKS